MRPIVFSLLILAMTGILWVGCRNEAQRRTPEQVATEFLTALHFGDFKGAKALASPESREGLDWYESTAKLGGNPFDQDFEVKSADVSGDYARVSYVLEDGTEKFLSLKHEKEAGWQVIVSKADLRDDDESDDNSQGSQGFMSNDTDFEKPAGLGKASDMAWEFLNALRVGDFPKAKDMGTTETRDALGMLEGMVSKGDNPYDRRFVILREEVKGKYAKVFFQQEGKDEESFLKLRNDFSNGWLVIMTKSELQDNVGEQNDLGQFEDELEKSAKQIEKELNDLEPDTEEAAEEDED